MLPDSLTVYSRQMPRRLLDAHSLLVVDFDDTDKVPLYAIISHISGFPNNWQEFLHQEVFDDQTEIEEQSEYSKLRKACSISTQLGIRYLWIDTCNDQRENDGFTQLRYAYYQNSEVCLVYLDDIHEEMSDYWYRSRWFKRGWTLLELVAPREQFFFNGHWRLLESRRLLAEGISATIGLGQNILADAPPISNVTIEERLRWVQLVGRTSLKPHDTVYCLMGVLEVEMEVNYDEPAEKTFLTFQEKFIQTHPHVPIPLVLEFLNWRCFLAAGYPVPPISWPSRESNRCPRRFIHTSSLQLVEFTENDLIPSYAILSHRWIHGQEVSYQEFLQATTDFVLKTTVEKTAGYQKIREACTVALQLGLDYLWIDTCCIDRSDHTDVAHDIKSMYSYYRNSAVCLVYLFDVQSVDGIEESEWFQRGWTLQELVAPREELFFKQDWNFIGSRRQNKASIFHRTRIRAKILEDEMSVKDLSLAERIRWIRGRRTTRPQDLAYCLLDILDIELEILYEEEKVETTFQRLQHELVQKLKIMEWDSDLNPLNLTWSFLSLGIPIPPVSWPVCEYGEVWPRCFIDTSTIQLIDLNADNNIIQPYAILSHSWINREEACYQEFREAATDPDIKVNLEGKSNYQIIQQACLMARQLGIQYLWIDICCIGKDKFSQDINSMFEYYRNSAVCLVYLNDVQKSHIISSKWFEDGWTLQGLLAPQEEIFFDQNWTFIGTRSQVQDHLVSATSIPPKVFKGTISVGEVDVRTRLKWIEHRKVAKLQDFVYCFMVILDVRMELYYDEPVERTLARFQDEFVRTHPEVSISVVLEYLTWRFLAAGYPIPPPSEWFSREIKACPPFFIDTSLLKIVHLSDGNAVLPYAVLLYQWTPMEPKYEKKSVDLPPKTGIIRRTFHLFKCALKKSKRQSPALQKATEHSLLSEDSQLTELSRLTKSNLSAFSISRQLGLRYLWIDTSSIRVWQGDIELVPSIDNEELKLIHGYYRNATVCLVHLQNAGKESEIPWSEWFKQDSRSAVEESLFFNADWSFRGSRRQFKNKYLYRTKPVRR